MKVLLKSIIEFVHSFKVFTLLAFSILLSVVCYLKIESNFFTCGVYLIKFKLWMLHSFVTFFLITIAQFGHISKIALFFHPPLLMKPPQAYQILRNFFYLPPLKNCYDPLFIWYLRVVWFEKVDTISTILWLLLKFPHLSPSSHNIQNKINKGRVRKTWVLLIEVGKSVKSVAEWYLIQNLRSELTAVSSVKLVEHLLLSKKYVYVIVQWKDIVVFLKKVNLKWPHNWICMYRKIEFKGLKVCFIILIVLVWYFGFMSNSFFKCLLYNVLITSYI